jgi:palmitoyltransferase ZDHHC4
MSAAILISVSISLSIVGVFYILMCTSPNSKGNKFLQSVLSLVDRVPGGRRVATVAKQAYEYVFWKRNPILQIVYLTLLGVGYGIAVSEIFPLVPNIYLDSYHKITFSIVFAATLISFYFACSTEPGYITKENIQRYNKYPYDFKMFTPKRCRTTGIVKPARSKFCSIMNRNVARYDHYCGWLAQPVGEENYRYFLLFLIMTCAMLLYATVGIALTIFSIIEQKDLRGATFINRTTGEKFSATTMMIFQWILSQHNLMVAVGFMTAVMDLVVIAFFSYHVYLVSRNQTSNESFKWSEFLELIQDAKDIIEIRTLRMKAAQKRKETADLSDLPEIPERYRAIAVATSDVTELHNIYDLGLWENFKEVLCPRSLRIPKIPVRDVITSTKKKKKKL